DQEPRGNRRSNIRQLADRVATRRNDRSDRACSRQQSTDAAMKIRSLTAPNPGPFTLDGTRTYLLGDHAVIDPGPAIESHIEAIRAAMPRRDAIAITHRHGDHAPAAVPLKNAAGARIIAPHRVLDEVDQGVEV